MTNLRSGLLLLALVESQKRNSHNLAHLEAAAGDITLRLTTLSEAGNKHLVVLIYVVKATITGHEASDLLSVLMSCTRTPLRMAELGCLASRPLLIEDKWKQHRTRTRNRNGGGSGARFPRKR